MKNRTPTKARRRDTVSVSLFPFLAVLICTMGVLIILLVIFTHQARLQAAEEARQKVDEVDAEVVQQRDEVLARIEQLKESRQSTKKQLADVRLHLGIIEDHSSQLHEKLKQLEATKSQMEQMRADGSKKQKLETELAETVANIARVETDIDKAKRQIKRQGRAYRPVIPIEGPNGTMRIPICVECRSDTVVIQPEEIVLTEADFEGPMGPGNPLAAALRAAREHMLGTMGKDLSDAEINSIEPYPLLLVRPDGTMSYNCVRQAMKSWGPDFGYELIDDNWNIAYGAPNLERAVAMQAAIDAARLRKIRLAAAAPRHYPGNGGGAVGSGRYTTSSSGGIVAYRGQLRKSRYRTPGERLAARQTALAGPSPRGRGYGTSGGSGTGGGSIAGGGYGTGSSLGGNGVGTGGGIGNHSGGALGGVNASATEIGVAGTGGLGAGGTGNLLGTNNVGQQAGGGDSMLGRGGSSGGNSMFGGNGPDLNNQANFANGQGSSLLASNGQPGNGQSGNGQSGSGQTGSGQTGSGQTGSGQTGSGQAGSGQAGGGQAGGGQAGSGQSGGGQPGSGQTGNGQPGNGQAGGGQAGGGQGGCQVAGGQPAAGQVGFGPSGMAQAGGGQSSNIQINMDESDSSKPPGGETPEGMVARPGSYTNSKQQQGRYGTALRPGEWAPSDPRHRRTKLDDPRANDKRPRRASGGLAGSRGKNWALPGSNPSSTPLVRPIRIECQPDRLILVPESGLSGRQEIVLDTYTSDSINEFVAAVWHYMDNSWGIAGRRMYWKPILKVEVAPGAEGRFRDLRTLLNGSGLEIKRRN